MAVDGYAGTAHEVKLHACTFSSKEQNQGRGRREESRRNLGASEEICISKPIERWQKPTNDYVKINSDGAFSASTCEGGRGHVRRGGDGKMAMKDNSYRLSMVGGSILERKSFVSENFASSSVVYVPRSCNRAAHAIAALGRMCPQETDLAWNGLPSCIEEIVASDIAEPFS
ncbi:retrotransposon protein, putative, unclassified [Panicum miliaceum]|uniref:Retrotransposon protein, putative, unclassified n=1 Tax=Panicum miliaceum TaxID=4540 RepID=A0A3L6T3P8_PANMI|nr:retrotransposon protein, putative, unclassified [Panicum miliaceum]